jgi:hypothetical protein
MNRDGISFRLGIKIIFFLFLCYFAYFLLIQRIRYNFLDNANLLFHEAGHLLFTPFGEFISFLGGSIMQLLVPLSVVVYFLLRLDYFSTGVCLFWLGENIINISYYIADAQIQAIPLLTGIHDWGYILGKLDLLDQAVFFGKIAFYLGEGVIIFSLLLLVLSLFYEFSKGFSLK